MLEGTKVKRHTAATIILLMLPQGASAAETSPQVVVFSILATIFLIAIILIYQAAALKGSANPDDDALANQVSILYKLNHRINPEAMYRIEVYRQSGNTERIEGPVAGKQVAEKVLSSMRRASITLVSISERSGGIDVRRVIYNGRGRQEGKRIGGYFINQISVAGTKFTKNSSAEAETIEKIEGPLSISTKDDAEAALIKSWYRIDAQFRADEMQSIRQFVSGFDMVSGRGAGTISQVDFFLFLSFVDKFLCGEAIITSSIRDELRNSDALHHKSIFEQAGRTNIKGLESFDVPPKDIKIAFTRWFNLLGFADIIRENRPRILSLDLDEY